MVRTHRSSRSLLAFLALVGLADTACGGGKSSGAAAPGESSGGDTGGGGEGGEPAVGPDGTPLPDAGAPPDAALPPAAVTFVLKNTGSEELAINMDRGWGGVILAFSGKPPKARSILMYPTFCTAACDAADEERCPVCEQPEKVADIRAAQKLEKIPVGGQVEARWDAQVYLYEKTRGKQGAKNARCSCWKTAEAPPETYTVRACGLRLTSTVEKTSSLTCAQGTMTLPVSEPTQVVLEFPDAPAPAAKGKKRR